MNHPIFFKTPQPGDPLFRGADSDARYAAGSTVPIPGSLSLAEPGSRNVPSGAATAPAGFGDTTGEKWLTNLAKVAYATDAGFFPTAAVSKAWAWLRE